jgi:hypothetical protein
MRPCKALALGPLHLFDAGAWLGVQVCVCACVRVCACVYVGVGMSVPVFVSVPSMFRVLWVHRGTCWENTSISKCRP